MFQDLVELTTPGDEQPPRFQKLTLNNGPADPTPKAANILRYSEEIITLIEGQCNIRDKTIVATCWSSGGRPEVELHELTLKDVEIEDGFARGSRSPRTRKPAAEK